MDVHNPQIVEYSQKPGILAEKMIQSVPISIGAIDVAYRSLAELNIVAASYAGTAGHYGAGAIVASILYRNRDPIMNYFGIDKSKMKAATGAVVLATIILGTKELHDYAGSIDDLVANCIGGILGVSSTEATEKIVKIFKKRSSISK